MQDQGKLKLIIDRTGAGERRAVMYRRSPVDSFETPVWMHLLDEEPLSEDAKRLFDALTRYLPTERYPTDEEEAQLSSLEVKEG